MGIRTDWRFGLEQEGRRFPTETPRILSGTLEGILGIFTLSESSRRVAGRVQVYGSLMWYDVRAWA
jgi:hypothetical protein